jgi:arylsulfatase A-like enzyme
MMEMDPATTRSRRPARLRRLVAEVRRDPHAVDASAGSLALVVAAAWFGLVTGLLELGLTLALKPFYDDALGFFRGNRHILWIVPLVNLAIFGACGLALGLLGRRRPRLALRLASFVFVFLAGLTLLLTIRGLYVAACLILAGGLAYRVAPALRARAATLRTLVGLSLPGLVVAVVALAAMSIGREAWVERRSLAGLAAADPGTPNVLLIVLDTVRADHLSAWGYHRATTPNLERWARRGVCFEQARSTAPWTLPSHASLFTGRWPHELSAGLRGALDGRYPTLAERLRQEGYVTAGFVANTTYCCAETGLNRGFAHYEDHVLSPLEVLRGSALGRRVVDKVVTSARKLAEAGGLGAWIGPGNGKEFKDAATLNRDFLAWLSHQEGRRRPFFAFLNYFDAHHPYVLPEGFDHHFGVRPESHADHLVLHRWWTLDKRSLPPRHVDLARDAYDDCLAYLDEQLGRLFADLERRGVLANTLVIVTADHGEHLGEHELYGHASSLYGPEVHVPLLVVGPAGVPAGASVREPVSLRDVPATVADLLGLEANPPFPGTSLARLWDAETERPAPGPVLSEVDEPVKGPANDGRSPVFRGAMKALTADDAVYIRNADGGEELFDLASDPAETKNLAGSTAAGPLLERFRAELERLLRGHEGPHAPK